MESLSDASDGPDPADVRVDSTKGFTMREDAELARIDRLMERLRARPLLPCAPRDPSRAYIDLDSGVRLPLLHCAFHGCTWTCDFGVLGVGQELTQWSLEWRLFMHLMRAHGEAFESELKTNNNHPHHDIHKN